MANVYLDWIKQILKKPDRYQYLKRYQLFKELRSFELHLVHNYMHKREYSAGETIFEEGHPLELVFFIETGEIDVRGKLRPGGPVRLKNPEVIGLIDLFHECKRSSTAVAITDVSLLAMSKTNFFDLVNKSPRLGTKLLMASCHIISKFIVDPDPKL